MNRAKSVFVSLYIMLVMIIMTYSFYNYFTSGSVVMAMIGLSSAIINFYFVILLIFKNIPRTGKHLLSISGPVLILNIVGLVISSDYWNFSLLIILGWFAYVYWYSVFDNRHHENLKTGSRLPSFKLYDLSGNLVEIQDYGGPAVVMFFRGNWCPFCMAQIKEIVSQYQELNNLGIKIILVSPQAEKHTISLSEKFGLPLIFLVDKDNQAALQLDIFQKNGLPFGMEVLGYEPDSVLPTVVLIDDNFRIIYTHLTDNYRYRPDPREFIEIFKAKPIEA